jgi:hypothetical protein
MLKAAISFAFGFWLFATADLGRRKAGALNLEGMLTFIIRLGWLNPSDFKSCAADVERDYGLGLYEATVSDGLNDC